MEETISNYWIYGICCVNSTNKVSSQIMLWNTPVTEYRDEGFGIKEQLPGASQAPAGRKRVWQRLSETWRVRIFTLTSPILFLPELRQ